MSDMSRSASVSSTISASSDSWSISSTSTDPELSELSDCQSLQFPLPKALVHPNTALETSFSHLQRICMSPLAKKSISLNEIANRSSQMDGNLVFTVELEMRFGSQTMRCSGTHMKVKQAREIAARYIVRRMQQLSGCPEEDMVSRPDTTIFSERAARILEDANRHLRTMQDLIRTVTESDQITVLDLEMWDQFQSRALHLLEVGRVTAPARGMWFPNGDDGATYDHVIVKENLNLCNGQKPYGCANHKLDFDENFGVSRMLKRDDIGEDLKSHLRKRHPVAAKVYLIGHSIEGDVDWLLKSTGVDLSYIIQIDLGKVYMALEGRSQPRSLTWLCNRYGIDISNAHNGGNDAVYTYLLAKTMVRDASSREQLLWKAACTMT